MAMTRCSTASTAAPRWLRRTVQAQQHLLMALHPDWSPAAIKSAIASTAWQDVLDSDGITPADPFDTGSGRINLSAAAFAGFVMEETSANYIAANPYLGGEPNSLNQPSMVEYTCIGTCSWTRTIKSTMDVAQDWAISFDAPAGMVLTASPMTFTLAAGGYADHRDHC